MRTEPFDPLAELLQRAADGPAAPAVVGDLASRVRQKWRRRAHRRAVGVAAVVAIAMSVALSLTSFRSHDRLASGPRPQPVAPVEPAAAKSDARQIRLELASLDAEAAELRHTVGEMTKQRAAEDQAWRTAEQLALPGAVNRIEAARQRTALILVRSAEQAAADADGKLEADESYRRAARLFPDTPAGRLAAGRLKAPHLPT